MYLLVKYGPDQTIERFDSYDQALAAYEAVIASVDDLTRIAYAVRSADDPRWARAPQSKDSDTARTAWIAARDYCRRELGATAKQFVSTSTGTFRQLENDVTESLRARGFKPSRYDVETAVKSRVVIGRCRSCGYGDRAFWFPKSEGRLADKRCPYCAGYLNQTTLALRSRFERLPRS
jgi:hypothetical protein